MFTKIDVTFGSTPTPPPPPPPPPSTTTKKKKKNTKKPIPQPRKEHVNHHQLRNHQLPLPSQVLLLIYLSRSSRMVRYCHPYSQMVHYCLNYHVSSQPILHFDFVISIAHIFLPSSTCFNSLFSIFCNQYLDIASDSYPATGIDTASSIVNTSTAYIPPITIPMTTTTSVAVASDASTATTSFHDPTTASLGSIHSNDSRPIRSYYICSNNSRSIRSYNYNGCLRSCYTVRLHLGSSTSQRIL